METKSILWNVYLIIIIILIAWLAIWAYRNVDYIIHSPCEACIKMGYSCSGDKFSYVDKSVDQAWKEVAQNS